jgi:hypothetical protein
VTSLNEPVYTDYALPQRFGYTLDDYLRLREVVERALPWQSGMTKVQ